jgi:hypothetical protein
MVLSHDSTDLRCGTRKQQSGLLHIWVMVQERVPLLWTSHAAYTFSYRRNGLTHHAALSETQIPVSTGLSATTFIVCRLSSKRVSEAGNSLTFLIASAILDVFICFRWCLLAGCLTALPVFPLAPCFPIRPEGALVVETPSRCFYQYDVQKPETSGALGETTPPFLPHPSKRQLPTYTFVSTLHH